VISSLFLLGSKSTISCRLLQAVSDVKGFWRLSLIFTAVLQKYIQKCSSKNVYGKQGDKMDNWRIQVKSYKQIFMCCVIILGAYGTQAGAKELVSVLFSEPLEPIRFGAQEIERALEDRQYRVTNKPVGGAWITLGLELGTLGPQCYQIRRPSPARIRIVGSDAVGCMYGGLELAEKIRLGDELIDIRESQGKPGILKRGIKFNIPLDARTPSYDDTGDAAQNNYAEMWNFAFWKEFLDDMARYRYNILTLWNPHPFPSIVKLPDYPDAALEDVCVTTLKPTYESGEWRDPQFVSPEVLKNLKVVKKLSIDEKIEFWRRVMKYAKGRGIDIYIITWNVLMNSAEGKYGITNAQDNPNTITYLRQCVRETVLTYPLLAGIGVTAGENMRNRNDEYDREKWLWKTYGLGIMDAKKHQPGREVKFIHRVWNTGLGKIMADFADNYPDSFEVGFKYARAHMYSSTKPPFCKPLLKEMEPYKVKCWWNLRNDDIFNFRWGDPEYVRAFLSNLPPEEKTAGYHMGSDGYVWGREFTSLEPETPRELEIRKHWYNFMLWGRLGYDLNLKRDFFEKVLLWRFPETRGLDLYDAWAAASKIIPLINRFHWRDWDFMWAVEGCFDQRKGFHTVQDFIKTKPMQESDLMSIPEYVEKHLANEKMKKKTPLKAAEELRNYANQSLNQVGLIRHQIKQMSKELRLTLSDIEAMSHLGNYYASKILGAVELHLFEKSGNQSNKTLAIQHLMKAQKHWEDYASVAGKMYKPQLLARTRVLDWMKILDDVKKDVEIARSARSAGK